MFKFSFVGKSFFATAFFLFAAVNVASADKPFEKLESLAQKIERANPKLVGKYATVIFECKRLEKEIQGKYTELRKNFEELKLPKKFPLYGSVLAKDKETFFKTFECFKGSEVFGAKEFVDDVISYFRHIFACNVIRALADGTKINVSIPRIISSIDRLTSGWSSAEESMEDNHKSIKCESDDLFKRDQFPLVVELSAGVGVPSKGIEGHERWMDVSGTMKKKAGIVTPGVYMPHLFKQQRDLLTLTNVVDKWIKSDGEWYEPCEEAAKERAKKQLMYTVSTAGGSAVAVGIAVGIYLKFFRK
ncbi:hypothetical protein HOD08_02770 [bacterium]|nr:hypothetical protein [bacterium]